MLSTFSPSLPQTTWFRDDIFSNVFFLLYQMLLICVARFFLVQNIFSHSYFPSPSHKNIMWEPFRKSQEGPLQMSLAPHYVFYRTSTVSHTIAQEASSMILSCFLAHTDMYWYTILKNNMSLILQWHVMGPVKEIKTQVMVGRLVICKSWHVVFIWDIRAIHSNKVRIINMTGQ